MRTIFVFGSNREGRHGKGAALEARQKWGAIYGQAEGLQGDSYAIITKELRRNYPPVSLYEVADGVERFRKFVYSNNGMQYLVSAIGCGLAGFNPNQIAPMFKWAWDDPSIINLPGEFRKVLLGIE